MKPSSTQSDSHHTFLTLKTATNNPDSFQYTLCYQWMKTFQCSTIWYSQTLYLSRSMQIASFTPVYLPSMIFSKEHYFWRFSETWSNASIQVFGNLPKVFLFPCSLGAPVGQHTNKMTINIMYQWTEFVTAGEERFYGRDLGISLLY